MSLRWHVIRGTIKYKGKVYSAGELLPPTYTSHDRIRSVYFSRVEEINVPDVDLSAVEAKKLLQQQAEEEAKKEAEAKLAEQKRIEYEQSSKKQEEAELAAKVAADEAERKRLADEKEAARKQKEAEDAAKLIAEQQHLQQQVANNAAEQGASPIKSTGAATLRPQGTIVTTVVKK